MSVEQREMTIARGLTRLKTIKAQLNKLAIEIGKYGAWNDKKRHPYGDNEVELKKNHGQAKEKIKSMLQQYDDLVKEYVKIKTAIDKANLTTEIKIGEKVMTISQALIYKRDIETLVGKLVSSYNSAVAAAIQSVEKHNSQNQNLDEETRKLVMADVLYLVPKERMEEMQSFLHEFLAEVDGTLNEVNAVTKIVIED